jgi:hypothetical protein
MADLVVDLGLLESTSGSLSLLIEEFSDASKIVSSYRGSLGDPALIAALDSFASDWQVHREQLLSSMKAVHDMAAKSHEAYTSTDDKLAQDLRKGGQH